MVDPNPYAPPQSPLQPHSGSGTTPFQSASIFGLWQKGRVLVMHRQATLPYVCIKSNQQADGSLVRKLNWHHPLVFILVPFSPLIYIIVALIITKRARIEIGLSEPYFARRRRDIIIGWSLLLLGVALIVLGIFRLGNSEVAALLPLGALLFLGGALYGLIRARLVSPERITNDYIWLKGVHPDILARLPPWPYQP